MLTESKIHNARRGLATIAYLKARFDAGMDHLEMLEPFVEEAIATIDRDDIGLNEVVNQVRTSARLTIPAETTKTLLQRAAKKGLLRRRGGRYFRTESVSKIESLKLRRDELSSAHRALAKGLREFAKDRGQHLASDDDALTILVEFLDASQICIVLGQAVAASPSPRDHCLDQIVASFVTSIVKKQGTEYDALDGIVKGLIVQNALLLRHVPRRRQFEELTVYLDTGVLLRALGYAGHTERNAAAESLEMIRKAGARLRVFEGTVSEVTSILQVYEERLGTPSGVKSLRPTMLTANWLRVRAQPSDIRQEVALLPSKLALLGVRVEGFPTHVPAYTENEQALADRLNPSPSDGGEDSRVRHDVEAVAAILTLRAGSSARRVQNTRFLFVSESARTIASVQEWYGEIDPNGLGPMVDLRWITNAVWMVGPAAAPEAPIHHLVAACAAMQMPDEKVWFSFIERLEELVDKGEVGDDESIAVLASAFVWERVAEMDPNTDVEADSVKEIVERVELQQHTELQGQVEDAIRQRDEANLLAAKTRTHADRVESSVERTIRAWSTAVSWTMFGIVIAMVVVGAYMTLPTAWSGEIRKDDVWSIAWWACVVLFLVLSVLGVVFKGLQVHELVDGTSSWLAARVMTALLPKEGGTE